MLPRRLVPLEWKLRFAGTKALRKEELVRAERVGAFGGLVVVLVASSAITIRVQIMIAVRGLQPAPVAIYVLVLASTR